MKKRVLAAVCMAAMAVTACSRWIRRRRCTGRWKAETGSVYVWLE